MPKKNILVLTPDTPHPSYIKSVVSPLAFLEEEYNIHPIDSLSIMDDVTNEEYYRLWQQELMKHLPHYDAFFGFSFGGVILQQCFSLFTEAHKPIILFSTPSFADSTLSQKLGEVISLCKENKVDEALQSLYQHVYYPNKIPLQSHTNLDNELAAKRVIFGLTRVLETDSRRILNENKVKHLHLIGERSHLVNTQNVIPAPNGRLISVPGAGMRMLRDNPSFCQQILLETLNSER